MESPTDFSSLFPDLADWLAGAASGDARARIERWARQTSANAELLRSLERASQMLGASRDSHNAADLLTRQRIVVSVLRRVQRDGTQTPPAIMSAHALRPPRVHRARWQMWPQRALLAATIGVAGVLTVLLWPSRPVTPRRSIHTTAGQRTTLLLADGSRVVLAPQTTMTVDAGFGQRNRTLSLDGEAYFDVASSHGVPFIVRTGHVMTRVLGTAFDVRQYRDEHTVRIAVVQGRVEVQGAHPFRTVTGESRVVLGEGMVGRIGDSTATVTIDASEVAARSAWTTGHLVFQDTPVSDVLSAVGRWYGYEFRIADSALARRELTVTFDGQSPSEVMTVLKTMLGVTLTFDPSDGHVVTLHPGAAHASRGVPRGSMRELREQFGAQPREVGR